ncbi:hypothetical protein Tco_0514387 [Tanacetum coccineum]
MVLLGRVPEPEAEAVLEVTNLESILSKSCCDTLVSEELGDWAFIDVSSDAIMGKPMMRASPQEIIDRGCFEYWRHSTISAIELWEDESLLTVFGFSRLGDSTEVLPDVAFAQNIASRFQQNPGEAHWTAVKNILKYLRNTKDTFFGVGGILNRLQVKCYCDAGFETDRDDTKSQTGYVFVLNGGAVVWKSSKQSTTAQHVTEAEYIAASEAVWIRKFIDELGVVPLNDYPIKMNCDNSTAIIIENQRNGIQKGARHFQRKYHYVRECIKTGEIDIVKVHTDENLADPFTKALAGPKLTRHARSMGLRPASSFM